MFYLVLLVFILLGILLKFLNKSRKQSLEYRHVVITGGSSGIGKALGVLAAQKGAHVSIISRSIDKLNKAQEEIKKHVIDDQQIITKVSVDVSNLEAVENNLLELEETVGPIYMLVNCAGLAICGKLEDLSPSDIKHLVDVNLYGSIYATKAVLAKFKERKEGIIVFTASAVALMGMFGYSVYSACKFALRGLAESVYMEAKPYNISVTLAMPPDTDTPGFEAENKSKPKETHLLSESGGLYKPEDVAKQILDDALQEKFFSYMGFESAILANLCVGMSPFNSILQVLVQSLILGPLRLIGAFYVKHFEGIVLKCFQDTNKSQKED